LKRLDGFAIPGSLQCFGCGHDTSPFFGVDG
jgi:hypothetical protein